MLNNKRKCVIHEIMSVMSIRVLKGIPSRMNIATPPPREFRSFLTTIILCAGIVSIFIVPESVTNARSINPQPRSFDIRMSISNDPHPPVGVRKAVTASSSAAEFIEVSLDLRDSRVDFAAFH